MSKVLMKGNEAMSEAGIRAGCKLFFGYPITPQTEGVSYMARSDLPYVDSDSATWRFWSWRHSAITGRLFHRTTLTVWQMYILC